MKILLLNIITFCFLQTAVCQITGSLVTANNLTIQSANVLLLKATDSSLVKSKLTDDKGGFRFENIAAGNYMLRLTSVGYQMVTTAAFQWQPNQLTKDFGTLVMQEQSQQLAAVVVRSEKPLYQQKPEGLVVNVENSVLTKGSTALEVLERSPGVFIDHHNNSIGLNGKSGVMVMLNGKLLRMGMEQLITLLNSMSADDIASIELLTTPSAKYDAEGTAGIINIVLKKSKRRGNSGSVTVTGGYGKAEKASTNLSIDHNTGKVDVYGSYSFNHDKSYSQLYALGSEIVPVLGSGITNFTYLGIGVPVNNSHNARAGVDYTINSKTTIGASVNYNYSVNHQYDANYGQYALPDSVYTFNGVISGTAFASNAITSIYAERKLREGEKFNVDVDYINYHINAPAAVQSTFVDKGGSETSANGDSLFSPRQNIYENATIQVGVLKLDYTKQLNKKVKLEAGVKGTYTYNVSTSGIASLINGTWVSAGEAVNNIIMKESIAAAYASAKIQINQSTNLAIGSRYEYYNTHANDKNTGATTLSRKMGQLFPSVFFTKKLNDYSDLQFSYTKRITRPTYNDLASYVTYNDPLSVFTGNPLLKPTITNNVKLGYNYHNYTFSLMFSRDDYPIAQGQVVASPSDKIVYISPQNVTYQNNLSLQANIPIKINNWWNMTYSVNGGWRQFRLDFTELPAVKSYMGYSVNFSQVFKLPGSISAELSGWYNSLSYYGSTKVNGVGALNAGIKKELNNNKGAFQLSITDLLRTTSYITHLGAVTEEAFDTKSYIKWGGESAKVPIIKLTYYRNFGNNKAKVAKHENEGVEEKDRIK